jgi:hypothetical protein
VASFDGALVKPITCVSIGGPVQYRWMYHIERALKRLRHRVGNNARVEGCIVEEFKYKEIAYFTSVYFPEEHNVKSSMMRYHVHQDDPCSNLSILKSRGTTVGVGRIYHIRHVSKVQGRTFMF